jgi:hypothetical protein
MKGKQRVRGWARWRRGLWRLGAGEVMSFTTAVCERRGLIVPADDIGAARHQVSLLAPQETSLSCT